jgi:translation initiation factor 2 subunit 3
METISDEKYDKFIKNVMKSQPIINIGMIGHVANGKSTLVRTMTGEATQRHSKEKIQNITIKLGYSNAKIWCCSNCPKPECYQSTASPILELECRHCKTKCELVLHVSFVDCPGHNMLKSTMINGTCVMDYAILVESVTNDTIPEIQTREHYEIAQQIGVNVPFACLNKFDLMIKNKNKIPNIVDGLNKFLVLKSGKKIPIIPVSGTLNTNIDVILHYISKFPIPKKDLSKNFKMIVIESFNINKEKMPISSLKGGVIGGSLLQGKIDLNDNVMIYPGYVLKNVLVNTDSEKVTKTKWTYSPLKSKILSISTGVGENSVILDSAIPGGLIGIQMDIDSAFTGGGKLAGSVVYDMNKKDIKVYENLTLSYQKKFSKCENIAIDELIKINVNSNNVKCIVKYIDDAKITLELEFPICIEIGQSVTISKYHKNVDQIDIFGEGLFQYGIECECV